MMNHKLFTLLFAVLLSFISCRNYGNLITEKLSPLSVDVYVAGVENNKACYWKNNVKVQLSLIDNSYAEKLWVENSNIYVLGRENQEIVFWKNGVKNTVTQYLNIPANNNIISNNFLMTGFNIDNNNIYIAANIKNPNSTSTADLYEYCYWKNGVKTTLQYQENMLGYSNGGNGIYVYNDNVYVPAIKNFTVSSSFPTTWDFGYYKNSNFNFLEVAANHIDFYVTPSGFSLLYTNFSNFKNINLVTNQTNNLNSVDNLYYVKTDSNEVYYSTGAGYIHNNTFTLINGIYGFGYYLDDFEILNGNKYILVNKDDFAGDHGSKIVINDVETQSIYSDQNGVNLGKNRFNSITVHQN